MLNIKSKRDTAGKLNILRYAKRCGNVAKTRRYFRRAGQVFHLWKTIFEHNGEQALINSKPCTENVDCVFRVILRDKLRTTCHFRPEKTVRYPHRFHDIRISRAGGYYAFVRHGLNRLPQSC